MKLIVINGNKSGILDYLVPRLEPSLFISQGLLLMITANINASIYPALKDLK